MGKRTILIVRFLGLLVFGGLTLPALAGMETPQQLTKRVFPLDILFGEGKAVVKRGPHNAPELKHFENELTQYPIVHVEIEGNPDPVGSAKYNRTLSQRRAQALRDTFVDLYHIPASRIQTHAMGETRAVDEIKVSAAQSPAPVFVILYRLEPSALPTH